VSLVQHWPNDPRIPHCNQACHEAERAAPTGSGEALRLAGVLDSAVADFLSEYDPGGPDDPDGASGVYDVALWEAHEAARTFLKESGSAAEGPTDE